MSQYVRPDIVQKFSGLKVKLWKWLEEDIGNQNGPFEIDQSELAEKFEVSRTAVINALKTFISANLMNKVTSGRGRGNHSTYELIWTFRKRSDQKCNPSRTYSKPQEKNITKGRQWRYYAHKFRTLVEDSSLKEKSQVVVGKILEALKGKPPDLFESWLVHLKRWLNGAPRRKSLTDFFVFFHKGLKAIMDIKLKRLREKKRRIRERKKRKKAKQSWQQNSPPKLSNFDRFADYQEAIKKWDGG